MGVTSTRDFHFADLMVGELREAGALPVDNSYAFALVWFVFATRPRTVAELAKSLGLHRCTLAREMSSAGLPPLTRWVQLARATWACRLIAEHGYMIGPAATLAGYPEQFTFSRQLKRVTGMRPTVVRQTRDWRAVLRAFVQRHENAGAA